MIPFFKARKEKKKAKAQKKDDSKISKPDASNGELEVDEYTSSGPLATGASTENQVTKIVSPTPMELERQRVTELEVRRQLNNLRPFSSPSSSAAVDYKTSRQPVNRYFSPAVLTILEDLGVNHREAQHIFYSLRLVERHEHIHKHILEYVKNGQEHGYGLKVINILRVVRDGDREFHHLPDKRGKQRLLLWHGTKKETVGLILKNGFVLPQQNGQMFGPGIYFADRASKSTNYCEVNTQPGNRAYLMLCDVLLGNVYTAKNPHNEFTEAPNGTTKSFNSVKCAGRKIPDPSIQEEFYGSKIPYGPTVTNTRFEEYTVRYNEFIVYSTENIKIMFVVEVEFTEKEDQRTSNLGDSNRHLNYVTKYR